MEAVFWGTRGSVPAPMTAPQMEEKIRDALAFALDKGLTKEEDLESFIRRELPFELASTYGGNTSCVEIRDGGGRLVLDMGSGLRDFGRYMLAQHQPPYSFDILMSHLHWDHVQGFPFFAPGYMPGTKINFWGGHGNIEDVLRKQHSAPTFPVDFGMLGASMNFHQLNAGTPQVIEGFQVTARKQVHHGDSFGYRIENNGKSVVYATDIELQAGNPSEIAACAEFFKGADLVIFDAMFGWGETQSARQDWGHSSNVVGVDLCLMAKARKLCLFHHDPANSDGALAERLEQTRRYLELAASDHHLEIVSSYDGLVLEL